MGRAVEHRPETENLSSRSDTAKDRICDINLRIFCIQVIYVGHQGTDPAIEYSPRCQIDIEIQITERLALSGFGD